MAIKSIETETAEDQTTPLGNIFLIILQATFKIILAIEGYYFNRGKSLSKEIPSFARYFGVLLRTCLLHCVELNTSINWDTSTIKIGESRCLATLGSVLGIYLKRDEDGKVRCCVRCCHNYQHTLHVNLEKLKDQQVAEPFKNIENLKEETSSGEKKRPKETSSSVDLS